MIRLCQILHAGDYFGELALLLQPRRVSTVTAVSLLQVYQLLKEDLAFAIANFPSLKPALRSVRSSRPVPSWVFVACCCCCCV